MASLSQQIKDEALRLGCCGVGIARAEALTPEGEKLRAWLARGYHATMSWMSDRADERTDPRAVMPSVRSVISIAMNYYSPEPHSPDASDGKISRYAWGDDYHFVVLDRLKELENFIRRKAPEAETRAYVDTGPVMDKVWASRAGVGWIGKHTNVITRGFGSWVFLGTLMVSLDLEVDEPETDMCGSCTACIEACPTGAIAEPYVLDAGRCISYLTIEHRGPLEKDLTSKFDGWVFGCDICQDVCPWNRFQQPTEESLFHARPENIAPPLKELAEMSQEDFSRRFRRSPVKRTKHAGLVRNARAVLESF